MEVILKVKVMRKKSLRLTLASVLFVAAFAAYAHSGATGVVKERMDNFKQAKKSMKTIKQAIKAPDFQTITLESEKLVKWGNEMLNYFPVGSNQKPSEAMPLIWQEWSRFDAHRQTYLLNSITLVESAAVQDLDAVRDAYGELAKSCKACHDRYKD